MTPRPGYIMRRMRELSPGMVFAKAAKHLVASRRDRRGRRADAVRPTFASNQPDGRLGRFLTLPERVAGMEWLEPVCEHYLGHRFDVLGSGWTQVVHGMRCRGLEGVHFEPAPASGIDAGGAWLTDRVSSANLSEARRIWSLVSDGYTPIDWHVDIKSGYRWSENTWFRDVAVAPERGADIKVPWELARCHHLPQMALLAGWSDAGERDLLAREFRDQILDFIATNPPRFGVNWACTMDIAIRAVNWLVAYDLFRAGGAVFDPAFENVLVRSILEHGRHIRANLEGDDEFRGNHYLADLVGLLFCAGYLPDSDESSEWWTFASREMVAQIGAQFLADGSSYEGSTGYHRLSTELAVWAVALMARVDGPEEIPAAVVARLERMAEFARDTAMPSGHDSQFGDTDSGRLLKLGVRYQWTSLGEAAGRFANLDGSGGDARSRYWLEEQLDHRHVIAAISGLVDREDLAARAGEWVDRELVGMLAGVRLRALVERDAAAFVRAGSEEEWDRAYGAAAAADSADRASVQEFFLGRHMMPGTGLRAYPDFGLYVFRGPHTFLAVRCGPVGQDGLGGHAHNDQLGIVLEIEGHPVAADPGSYLYTPLPERRNEYRSVRAHNAPWIEGLEPASLEFDLFRLGDPGARCVYFGERGFVGSHRGYGPQVWRLVEVLTDRVRVVDWCDDPAVRMVVPRPRVAFSPGYGWREREGAGAR